MNNGKIIENKKEDSKAFVKFIIIIVVSGLLGGVMGFTFVLLGDSQKTFSEILIRGLGIISPLAPVVLTTILIIWVIISEKKCRKLFAEWDGEETEALNRIEMKLSYILIAATVNMILVYFFFGTAMYHLDETYVARGYIKAVVAMVGFIYAVVSLTLIQKRIVNFEKEINPEKQGSIYDSKFQKKWLASCDEGEKFQIYKSAYKAYQVTNITCTVLWVVTTMGMMTFDFGILPMTCVVIIWLATSLGYGLETLRLSKHPSEIMK